MESLEQKKKRLAKNSDTWRKKHPEKFRSYMKKAYWNRRIKLFNLLGGAFCSSCGCDEVTFLEINHINGGGCKEWKETKGGLTDKILSGQRHTKDVNVLCRVCNAIDFLMRKNPNASGKFVARWEKYTGNKAVLSKE